MSQATDPPTNLLAEKCLAGGDGVLVVLLAGVDDVLVVLLAGAAGVIAVLPIADAAEVEVAWVAAAEVAAAEVAAAEVAEDELTFAAVHAGTVVVVLYMVSHWCSLLVWVCLQVLHYSLLHYQNPFSLSTAVLDSTPLSNVHSPPVSASLSQPVVAVLYAPSTVVQAVDDGMPLLALPL